MVPRVAPRHADRIVTTDYCDVTSLIGLYRSSWPYRWFLFPFIFIFFVIRSCASRLRN